MTTSYPWDEHNPANRAIIQANCDELRRDVLSDALAGNTLNSDIVRDWHRRTVRGVPLAEPNVAGNYRGTGPSSLYLRRCPVSVGGVEGTAAVDVPAAVAAFFSRYEQDVAALDSAKAGPFAALYSQVLNAAAALHGEWTRIHPFANHNGTTARLMTLHYGARYGVAFAGLPAKPRSAAPVFGGALGLSIEYPRAAQQQMLGNDHQMRLYLDQLAQSAMRQP